MATMNRNINLEEINADAFMGITFLNHQTIIQKVVFRGTVILAIIWNIIANFVFQLNPAIVILFTLIPVLIGVLFGGNYNQDLSLIKYICLITRKKGNVLVSKPTEGLDQLKTAASRIAKDKELKKRQEMAASPDEHKKFLIRVLIGAATFILIFVIVIILLLAGKTEEIHHMVYSCR